MSRRIAIGADHAGFPLKEELKHYLERKGLAVDDLGTHGLESVDYPHYGEVVARAVVEGRATFGLLFCGTGVGIGIAANKVAGVRCATVSEATSARLAREHNNANVLSMGARIVGVELAKDIVDAFLSAEFQEGRHQRRIDQLALIEKKR